ncbi:hypothetical protein KIN20_025505 [Parelaphostrongylus tenuis]|uniref:Uncharacterized protein n=1 Tax=Parelaphostrongylus tenuis TaxID=148309 RepID=A0AAD5MYI6_PARTN|nr:hypothetical protein KIN20_025505 [Parelaphostrongylus tenuis]
MRVKVLVRQRSRLWETGLSDSKKDILTLNACLVLANYFLNEGIILILTQLIIGATQCSVPTTNKDYVSPSECNASFVTFYAWLYNRILIIIRLLNKFLMLLSSRLLEHSYLML